MHLSYKHGKDVERLWNYAKDNNLIGLDPLIELLGEWNEVKETVKDRMSRIWINQMEMFVNEMKLNDIVVILEGWHSLLGVVEELKECEYRRELSSRRGVFFDHVRPVAKWRRKYDYGEHPELPERVKGFNNTLSKVEHGSKRWSILTDMEIS